MNKKFLSVILSTSMVLSPFGGKYCFAQTVAEPDTVEDEARYAALNAEPDTVAAEARCAALNAEPATVEDEASYAAFKAEPATVENEARYAPFAPEAAKVEDADRYAPFAPEADTVEDADRYAPFAPEADTVEKEARYAALKAEPDTVADEARFTDFNAEPKARLHENWVSELTEPEREGLKYCLPRLQKCAKDHMRLSTVLLLNNDDFNDTVRILNKYPFSVPTAAFLDATRCRSTIEDCVDSLAGVCVELHRHSLPITLTPFLDEEQSNSGKHYFKGLLTAWLGGLLTRQLINKCFNK